MLAYRESFQEEDLLNEKRLKEINTIDNEIKKKFEEGYNLIVIERSSYFCLNNRYYLLQDDLDD